MLTLVIAALAILGFAVYIMTPHERVRLVRWSLGVVRRLRDATGYLRPACEPFFAALRARTRWVIVTPLVAGLNVTIFVLVLAGSGPLAEPATIVEWGAIFGPRTTNGEWWRLVTAMFIHAGALQLIINVAAFIQVGLLLERLLGHLAFAAVYVSAGVLSGVVHLAADPVAVTGGAAGGIFGLYGLLLASVVWGLRHPSAVSVPIQALLRLVPLAALFVVAHLMSGSFQTGGDLTGLVAGLGAGAVLARGVDDRTPSARRVAVTVAATLATVVVSAVPLRGLTDVRPELARIVALEDQASGRYHEAVARFTKGHTSAGRLAELIEQTIVPELRAAGSRLETLSRVPQEHRSLMADATEYLRLREASWRLRATALQRVSMAGLREADEADRVALAHLERIRSAALP